MNLREYIDTLSYDTAFWMAGVWNSEYPIDQLGDLSLEVSRKLRAMAVMVLVANADSDTFYHNLIRSGIARERYLSRCLEAGAVEDHHRASARYEPLLDAVAAGEFALARRIAALSPRDYRDGHEYEDDYCYAQILHHLIQDPPDRTDIPALLERFEAYLERQGSARLQIVRALAFGAQPDFDNAFDEILRDQEARIRTDKHRGQLEEPGVMALRQVFVEGLALLRLAGNLGFQTEPEYRFCPSLARRPMRKPFPGE